MQKVVATPVFYDCPLDNAFYDPYHRLASVILVCWTQDINIPGPVGHEAPYDQKTYKGYEREAIRYADELLDQVLLDAVA